MSIPFQVLKEIFFLGIGLTVTEINIEKVQKEDLKSIKTVKGCRDAMSKSQCARFGIELTNFKCPFLET